MTILIGGLIGSVIGVAYFLPTIIAIWKNKKLGKKKVVIVYIVNVFFGWTIVGWFLSLIIAIKE